MNISISQSNLIRNSSFESFSNQHHPSLEGLFDCYNPGYIQIVHDWNIYNSPDHFDTAYNIGTYNVPVARFGNSYAKHGHAYAGFILFTGMGETKEYISQHLTSPLKKDSTYCLSFFTTRSDNITHAIHSVGAYFSVVTPSLGSNVYLSDTPQIINQTGFITDTVGWIEVQGCYTAQGGEEYITIGNFNSNANTDTLYVGAVNPMPFANKYAYYYIDSVTLWQNNFPTAVKENAKSEVVSVWPNPASSVINVKIAGNSLSKNNYGVKIADVLGKEIINEAYKEQIDISHLEKGIYFLSIYDSNHLLTTKKVIKE